MAEPRAVHTGAFDRRQPILDCIPPAKQERNRLLSIVRAYIERTKPIPPLTLQEVFTHADAVIKENRIPAAYRHFLAVLVNNEAWKEQVAGFPYDRRLLLLPKCLRSEEGCAASVDTFGIVCHECGRCPIGDLQAEAVKLGYVVMVAEGSPVVMQLIETGQIDAVVGVSCISVLERVFPYMEAGAVPGVAIPLLNEGCSHTSVDLDWVWDAVHMLRDDPTPKLDLEALRSQVQAWFTLDALEESVGPVESRTEEIARAWLAKAGKRWRPFLAACAYQAFQDDPAAPPPRELHSIAVAIECFHKASLIHDDIEDNDGVRYGEKTLHAEYGIPVALNAGDLLLGEGYRLLAESSSPYRVDMLRVVAEGHRALAVGQGAELYWARDPVPLSPARVLDIFRLKTAPAFEVALRVGAIQAGVGEELKKVLKRFSTAIGIAYQIRDDLEDFSSRSATSDLLASRPSLLLAFAYEKATGATKKLLSKVWRRTVSYRDSAATLDAAFEELAVREMAHDLLDFYKGEAIRALCGVDNAQLKGLLRRVVGRIFNEVEVMGCCNEYQAGNAAGGEGGSDAAA